jgi:DnaJ domain
MAERPALDPYTVLGVPRTASALQVARAYRRLAKQFHPDLNPDHDVSERMRRVNDAWHTLSSSVRRAEFDRQHPAAGTNRSGHWAGNRPRPVTPPAENAARWASWRASADETRAAPRTHRQPGEVPIPPTRRPPPLVPAARTFRDSGWAALLAALAFLAILVAAVLVGRLA